MEAVASINKAIRIGNAAETAEELTNPEAQLPIVYQTAANLYQNELFSLQLQGERVRFAHVKGVLVMIIETDQSGPIISPSVNHYSHMISLFVCFY